ncbi:protein phosphatase 1 regulatory subunit 12A isoform X11 [Sitodiplosis mosellana]|uniref:protein phosphatase 1 regulatory subunit 12A isoform X11 n=1 Tax=Sitodiplosis mosellana TaxID=263140 RepID=UPI00244504A0|nr:protein phosphatase 1 regulatory subunit 12A isoform X11 [Sitodiplosis mosellana]
MSFDARNNSAVLKRAEQLKRWEDSDTNRASNSPKDPATRRVKFSSGCVFLAACLSGDKEDIIRLIENGVDIDTANVDGLTALHQACIDDNLEMVEFLVQHGADVNKQDNEGWTPLHATASCGFLSIAQYLIENNADLAAVNSDGDLPIDLSDSDRMHALLEKHLIEQGIDCDEARQSEEKIMLHDAECWLRNDASEADRPHPRTGATALHVAAAKGYNKVLGLLLATRADVDKQDNDGWTPLHAAARWGQKDAAQMLVAALADMDIKNHAGQTPIDVADPSIVKFLEELQKSNKRTALRRPASQIRLSDNIYNHFNIETPKPKVMKSDTKNIDEDIPKPPSEPAPIAKESQLIEDEAPWRRPTSIRLTRTNQNENPPKIQVPEKESPNTLDSEVMLRRTQSFENDEKFYQKYIELRRRINANSYPVSPATLNTGMFGVNSTYTIAPTTSTTTTTNNFTVQRSASLKDYKPLRINSLPPSAVASTATNNTLTTNTTTTTATTPVAQQQQRSSGKIDDKNRPKYGSVTNLSVNPEISNKISQARSLFGGSAFSLNKVNDRPLTPYRHASSATDLTNDNANDKQTISNDKNSNSSKNPDKTSPKPVIKTPIKFTDELQVITQNNEPAKKSTFGHIFKNFFKSFVPPARDEESETQRKAHAKRVRETRRSTQGVTLEEIKSAEELVKKKNLNNNNNSSSNNNNNNFKLEDATLPATSTNSIVDNNNLMGQRRTNLTTTNTVSRPLSAPVVSSSTIVDNTSDRSKETPIISTDVTVSLKKNRSGEDKENEKENDSRGGQATQAIIQRRRRPKRRSTGVCNVGAEDADNERQDSPVDGDESGSEKTSTRSRLGSSSSITSEQSPVADNSENGGEAIDYKALYEAARSDNDKLKNQLKKKDDDLMNARAAIDRFTNATTKNTLSELEKREKRAMERKISEMEEELKQLDVLKTENQRLRDENGALIRVISKLSK